MKSFLILLINTLTKIFPRQSNPNHFSRRKGHQHRWAVSGGTTIHRCQSVGRGRGTQGAVWARLPLYAGWGRCGWPLSWEEGGLHRTSSPQRTDFCLTSNTICCNRYFLQWKVLQMRKESQTCWGWCRILLEPGFGSVGKKYISYYAKSISYWQMSDIYKKKSISVVNIYHSHILRNAGIIFKFLFVISTPHSSFNTACFSKFLNIFLSLIFRATLPKANSKIETKRALMIYETNWLQLFIKLSGSCYIYIYMILAGNYRVVVKLRWTERIQKSDCSSFNVLWMSRSKVLCFYLSCDIL